MDNKDKTIDISTENAAVKKSAIETADDFLERILLAIADNNIQNYLLTETITETEELFYIKKDLNLMRNKSTTKCEITIYHDFEEDGKPMRGSSSFIADPNMKVEELHSKISSAYTAALSVRNPYYKLPHGDAMFCDDSVSSMPHNGSMSDMPCNDSLTVYSAANIAEMLYAHDHDEIAFINSSEIFVTSKKVHTINSNGVNVSYSDIVYSGEYVVQAKTPCDVELYYDFEYSYLDREIEKSLGTKLKSSLKSVRDRAAAVSLATSSLDMKYETIILEGNTVYELFSYYVSRLDASMIYPGYSNYAIGKPVVPEMTDNNVNTMNIPANIKASNSGRTAETDSTADNVSLNNIDRDKLNITLAPKQPFTSEGIRLIPANVIRDNTANYITGNAQFSFYLGIPAIGTCSSYTMECGTTSLEELESKPYLKIVNFSDFQMNTFTGQFGGEFRLGYYFDGVTTIPVTNGSISGNIDDVVKTMRLSAEKQSSYHFEGPLAVAYSS